jgi:hypothetical protein
MRIARVHSTASAAAPCVNRLLLALEPVAHLCASQPIQPAKGTEVMLHQFVAEKIHSAHGKERKTPAQPANLTKRGPLRNY